MLVLLKTLCGCTQTREIRVETMLPSYIRLPLPYTYIGQPVPGQIHFHETKTRDFERSIEDDEVGKPPVYAERKYCNGLCDKPKKVD